MLRFLDWNEEYRKAKEVSPHSLVYEDEYGYPILGKRKRKYHRTAPVVRRVWWADMDDKAKTQCNETAARLRACRDHHEELQIVDDLLQGTESTLVQIGQYVGSHGTYVWKEEYKGQEKAYKHCRTITEYLGNLE